MFTGIVEELGNVAAVSHGALSAVLTIRGEAVLTDAAPGESIAVNGVCLTVVERSTTTFSVDVMAETLRRTSLGALEVGDVVNLERAMRADGRFGGHIVQGHVDAAGQILAREPGDRCEVVTISLPDHLRHYVVPQGSITVDGVSLTVTEVHDSPLSQFSVSLIPTTLALTTLGRKGVGAPVNLEVDVLAKYVERMMTAKREEAR